MSISLSCQTVPIFLSLMMSPALRSPLFPYTTLFRSFNRLSDIKIPEDVGDFRLLDRNVIEAIKRLPEKDRFMKGLFCWPGMKHTVIEFEIGRASCRERE